MFYITISLTPAQNRKVTFSKDFYKSHIFCRKWISLEHIISPSARQIRDLLQHTEFDKATSALYFSMNFLACIITYYYFNNVALKFKIIKKENAIHNTFESSKRYSLL